MRGKVTVLLIIFLLTSLCLMLPMSNVSADPQLNGEPPKFPPVETDKLALIVIIVVGVVLVVSVLYEKVENRDATVSGARKAWKKKRRKYGETWD